MAATTVVRVVKTGGGSELLHSINGWEMEAGLVRCYGSKWLGGQTPWGGGGRPLGEQVAGGPVGTRGGRHKSQPACL